MEWQFPFIDLTVRQDLCNLRCTYCGLTKEAVPKMTKQNSIVGLLHPDGTLSNTESSQKIFARAESQIKLAGDRFNVLFIKVSGGELTALPGWLQFLEKIVHQYAHVQILTNGTLLTKEICLRLASFRNLSVQISLDGIDRSSNRFRGLNSSKIEHLKTMIICLVENGVKVELMCVLTYINILSFVEYCTWANSIASNEPGKIVILPKPVNGIKRSKYFPRDSYIDAIKDSWVKLPLAVLPPQSYILRLFDMLSKGERQWPCYVPFFVLGLSDDGANVCTCSPDLGIMDLDSEINFESICFNPSTASLLCRDCMSYYDLLNLVVEGKISMNELKMTPSFEPSFIRNKILKVVNEIRDHLA